MKSLQQWSDEIQVLQAHHVFALNLYLFTSRCTGFGLLRCRVFRLGRLLLLDSGDADSPCHSPTKPQFDPQEILRLAERTDKSGSLIRGCLTKLARSSASELELS